MFLGGIEIGVVKRKYTGELMRFNKSLKHPLNLIQDCLPREYSKNDILRIFKELYPNEWNIINQRYKNYLEKDKFLEKKKEKKKYNPEEPEKYFFNLEKVKHMASEGMRNKYKNNFVKESQEKNLSDLKIRRKDKIEQKIKEIDKLNEKIQFIEPLYIDVFIDAYHKKGITTEGKIEIFKELQKYECEKSTEFFYKLNDSEKNNQIRNMAFKHLQKSGKYAKLRQKFKGKQKSYMLEKDAFFMKPVDLVNRIKNNTIQNKKTFDYFISHSSKDKEIIMGIKGLLNKSKKNIYCDWTSDNDFLKREYVSIYTEIVLKKRIKQSKEVIFVRTKNTQDVENKLFSKWVAMELEYSKKLGKKIFCIDFLNDCNCKYEIINFFK